MVKQYEFNDGMSRYKVTERQAREIYAHKFHSFDAANGGALRYNAKTGIFNLRGVALSIQQAAYENGYIDEA